MSKKVFEEAIDLARNDSDEAFIMRRVGNEIYIDSWYDGKKVKYVFENEEQAKDVEERALKIAEALEYLYFDLNAFELALKTTYNVVTEVKMI